MSLSHHRPGRFVGALVVLFLSVFTLGACGGSGGGDSGVFVVRTAKHGVDATSTPVVAGIWMVYFADEASSGVTDLNMDSDTADDVAVAVNLANQQATVLRAALFAAIVNGNVYLVVDEALDGTDWDGDVADNIVLLHWSLTEGAVSFIDLVDPSSVAATPLVVEAGLRVYYSTVDTPTGDDTTLRYIPLTDPLVPVTVQNQDLAGPLAPIILGQAEGLIFLGLNEVTGPGPLDGGPPDYNLDADSTDEVVLALLDGTDDTARVLPAGLALRDVAAPLDARREPLLSQWLFATLVNESEQGNTNLNDQALFVNPLMPNSCAGTPDTDMDDDVLFYGRYETLITGTPAVNSGLAGRDRVVAVKDYVATLTDEADATCDMNEDADSADTIVRWLEAVDIGITPTGPPRDPSQLHAVFDVPGGSAGLVGLGDRFITVVDEAADSDDINLDLILNDTLVGHIDPALGALVTWTFSHPTGNPGTALAGEPFVGTNWMADEESEGRIGLAFMEETVGFTLNVESDCEAVIKDSDAFDSMPVWADFSGTTMDFDGQGYSLHEADPGIVLSRGFAFYRVSEAADAVDYDGDGTMSDVILFRNPQTICQTVAMATASSLPGTTCSVFTDNVNGAVFLADEFMHGSDLNGDGDLFDIVPRFFIY